MITAALVHQVVRLRDPVACRPTQEYHMTKMTIHRFQDNSCILCGSNKIVHTLRKPRSESTKRAADGGLPAEHSSRSLAGSQNLKHSV
jgi:hypothetical protein